MGSTLKDVDDVRETVVDWNEPVRNVGSSESLEWVTPDLSRLVSSQRSGRLLVKTFRKTSEVPRTTLCRDSG